MTTSSTHRSHSARGPVRTALLAAGAALVLAGAAQAGTFTDPVGDFLATYTGQQYSDLDVVGGSVTFDGVAFTLTAQLAGDVGFTAANGGPAVAYVWGMNHGAADPTKPGQLSDGAPNHLPGLRPDLLIDESIIVKSNGQMLYQLASSTTPVPYAAGVVTIDGNMISGTIKLADIISAFSGAGVDPSKAFADPLDYTFSLWPKYGTGGNAIVADFGPDTGVVTARTAVPEPASWTMMICGFAAAGTMLRRRRLAIRAT